MKRKVALFLLSGQEVLARGHVYPEGNVEINWRCDRGWTSEQYSHLGNVYGILPGVTAMQFYPPVLEVQHRQQGAIFSYGSESV